MTRFKFTIILFFLTGFAFSQDSATVTTIVINFDYDKYQVKNNEYFLLEDIVANPLIKAITIKGFTDSDGSDNYNLNLSLKRAKSVESFLLKDGLPPEKIKSTIGSGEIQTGNKSENRRVEITIEFEKIIIEKIKVEPYKEEGIPITSDIQEQSILKESEITNLEIGHTLTLKGLNFIPGRHFLVDDAVTTLNELITILENNPNVKIEIQGHICCLINGFDGLDVDTQTMNLSLNRAQYVYNYLITNGISPYRLSFKGYGASKPKVTELNDADRQTNRRVEIMITAK
jgi:outer membrane protein OmpA-like peptidoglycan-associated protein